MGWLPGSSTRTPTRFISIMLRMYPLPLNPATESARPGSAVRVAVRPQERDERGRVPGQRADVFHSHDEREVPVDLVEVKAVAEHELVGAVEPPIPDVDRGDPSDRLVQQGADLQRRRVASPQRREKVRQGQPRVDDVLDDDDVAPADVPIEVLHDPDHAGAAFPVRGDRHEVHAGVKVDGPEEVRVEHGPALQHRDQDRLTARVLPGDPRSQGPDPITDVARRVEDGDLLLHAPDHRRLGTGLACVRCVQSPKIDRHTSTKNPATASKARSHHGSSSCGAVRWAPETVTSATAGTRPRTSPSWWTTTSPTASPSASGRVSPGSGRTSTSTGPPR